jgi:hypothetical protein
VVDFEHRSNNYDGGTNTVHLRHQVFPAFTSWFHFLLAFGFNFISRSSKAVLSHRL